MSRAADGEKRSNVNAGGQLDAETALAMLYYVELLQIQYGAIILSFLGAIHWGLEVRSSPRLWQTLLTIA